MTVIITLSLKKKRKIQDTMFHIYCSLKELEYIMGLLGHVLDYTQEGLVSLIFFP
jgi:hypothetical protein